MPRNGSVRGTRCNALGIRAAALVALACVACDALGVARYAIWPDPPRYRGGETVELAQLRGEVRVTRRSDGLWRIEAENEHDAMHAEGYLMARDRMAQLDLFRHLARGELAAWIGDRPFGDRTALDVDRLNRFLGFRDRAAVLMERTSDAERRALDAFVAGINRWIDEGVRSPEHRLLGVREIRSWTAEDSLTIYLMIMHGLGGNADREIRRLAIACEAGLDALGRVWPGDVEFEDVALPQEAWREETTSSPPAVVPEMAAELDSLCSEARSNAPAAVAHGAGDAAPAFASVARILADGWSASNNWAVRGSLSASRRPVLSSDPHLPHMNPPIVWGVDVETPEGRVVGFTLPGLHRVVFGHNGFVAWGATTNHVDRQDLALHRERIEIRDGRAVEGYEVDGIFAPFEVREERFEVRGGEPVTATARFTVDGPILNDLEPYARDRLPLVSLRRVSVGRGSDLDGARAIQSARTAAGFAAGIALLDLGCSSWVFADVEGHIGFRSPCQVPIRAGWRGTFPVPGWLSRYHWRGVVPERDLPAVDDPSRGWLATANSQIVPSRRFPTAYNNDASAPNRFLRIARRLADARQNGGLTMASSSAIQLDVGYAHWPRLRAELAGLVCDAQGDDGAALGLAAEVLCPWDGAMDADSPAPSLYTLWTHALLDRALADDLPGGTESETWRFAQSLLQFEANVGWLWERPADAAVWDDAATPEVERRADIVRSALAAAVLEAMERWGDDPAHWAWGRVRPFELRHPFSSGSGPVAWLLDVDPVTVGGGNETVFKQQFPRSDREHMRSTVGPVVRFTVDLADPWAATYSLAGGESGWPRARFYGNLLDDWSRGRERPLTPAPATDDVIVRFVPSDALRAASASSARR